MIDIDITMLIQIANVLILIVIMNAVLYRPVRTILEEREKKIGAMGKDVETFHKNAKLRLEEFEKKIQDGRDKAKAEIDQARSAAQATGSEALAAIRKEADAAKAGQLAEIEKEFAAARQELHGQVDGFASEMASKVLGRAL